MPESSPRWPSRPALRSRPRRDLRGDSEGVSEVIGYILVFGILSMILLLSMLAFNVAQEAARDRAVELRAESAAARVAGVAVKAAVLAEQESASDPTLHYVVDLPDNLEGMSYRVRIDPGVPNQNPPDPDLIRIEVPALDLEVTAPLFSASAPANIHICDSTVAGGSIQVRFAIPAAGLGCTLPAGVTKGIFLQVTP